MSIVTRGYGLQAGLIITRGYGKIIPAIPICISRRVKPSMIFRRAVAKVISKRDII